MTKISLLPLLSQADVAADDLLPIVDVSAGATKRIRAGALVAQNSSENRIINGDMNVWQRGTSSAAAGYVAADRWCNNITGGAVTQARQPFSFGFTLGGVSPTFYLRQSVSGQTLAGHYANTFQAIEGVRSYAGQTITVLGWARRSSGAGDMVVEAEQYFGGGGSPSAAVVSISPTTVTLDAAWSPFAAVMTVPSVAGKTLGTDGSDRLSIAFWTSAGSTYAVRTNSLGIQTIGVDLWGIHIRVGTWAATDTDLYRPRDPGTELALCERYFIRWPGVLIAASTRTATVDRASIGFSTPMRAIPQVASSITSGGGSLVIENVHSGGFNYGSNGATSATTLAGYTADAEL